MFYMYKCHLKNIFHILCHLTLTIESETFSYLYHVDEQIRIQWNLPSAQGVSAGSRSTPRSQNFFPRFFCFMCTQHLEGNRYVFSILPDLAMCPAFSQTCPCVPSSVCAISKSRPEAHCFCCPVVPLCTSLEYQQDNQLFMGT